jgi:ferredoxin
MIRMVALWMFVLSGNGVCDALDLLEDDDRTAIRSLVNMFTWNMVVMLAVVASPRQALPASAGAVLRPVSPRSPAQFHVRPHYRHSGRKLGAAPSPPRGFLVIGDVAIGLYRGGPFSRRLGLPDLEPAMFDRWLTLFGETCIEVFEPEAADAFSKRAAHIARNLRMGLFERVPALHACGRTTSGIVRDSDRRGASMTYVVTDNCINHKYMDFVEVCPVDRFCVGENMLVIHPDECIDCGVCAPECPVDAIVTDSDARASSWVERNRVFATNWPNITHKSEFPPDADEWKDKPGKEALFSPKPGREGDKV